MKVKQFDKSNVNVVSSMINDELKALGKKLGIEIRAGRGKYSSTNFTLKLEMSVMDGGEVITKEAVAFKELASLYGFKKSDLGKSFMSNGKKFTITGLNTRAKKYPINAVSEFGASYKFTANRVQDLLKRS